MYTHLHTYSMKYIQNGILRRFLKKVELTGINEIYTEWNFESDYFDWLHEQKIMKYIQNGILRAFFDTLHIVRNPHEIYTEWNFELCRKLHSLCIMP